MNSGKAAIIIVNWNGLRFLKNCLNSVYKQTYKNFQVYFVDNGSIDRSSEFVKQNYSKTKIIQLDKNYGFAKPNNTAIKKSFKDKEVEYIVCLNNDTIVDKNWLKELIKTAQKDKSIGAVGSTSLYPNKTIQNSGIKLSNSKTFNENTRGEMSMGFGQKQNFFKNEFEIFAPSGVSALYKKEVLSKTGLFDEDFFAYCEDIDLGFRIDLMGFKSICNPKSRLIHYHSKTGRIASPFKAYYSKRNSFFMAIKYFSFLDLILYPFRDLYWNIKSAIRKNENKSVEELESKIGLIGLIWIMLKVYLAVLYYFPKILIKRWKIKNE